jgi:membrane-bound lytic murein transglycosylase D
MRHKIHILKITISGVFIVAVLLCGESRLLSWGLFNYFTDTQYSAEGQGRAESFDPDRDILYLPPLTNKDIFEASRDLSICRNKSVRKYIYIYLTAGREYLVRGIRQSYRYEGIISGVLKRNADLPEELGLLPLLESCFDPRAVSSSRAVGLWQFVDNTAKPLGLQCNRWLDERRHVEKSTEAALRHLRNMRQIFPRWDLALAAYNGGAGYVKRSMDKNRFGDFWKLHDAGLLRDETSEYVPKFIALLVIYKNQRLFGVSEEAARPEKLDTEYFTLRQPVDLREVSRITGVPLQTIRDLNPELNTTITPPASRNYQIRVPSDTVKKLNEKSGELYRNKISTVTEYRVKSGDTISGIARHYKKKLNSLFRLTA